MSLAISDVAPIRTPDPIAIMKKIMGNVIVIAARASELNLPRNIASIILKAVCRSMATIIGADSFMSVFSMLPFMMSGFLFEKMFIFFIKGEYINID